MTNQPEKTTNKKWYLLLPIILLIALCLLFFFLLNNKSLNKKETSQQNDVVIKSTIINKKVPLFSLSQLDNPNQLLTNANLPKQPYLLNVWATWCPSCMAEHGFFVSLANQGVVIIGNNYNDSRDMAIDFLKNNGNPFLFNLFDDEGSLAVDLGITGAPETYVVDGNGIVRMHIVGIMNAEKWQTNVKPCYDTLLDKTASSKMIEKTCQTS